MGALSCVFIETYLLEKSRVTTCMPKERNYHIFYQLLSCPQLTTELEIDTDASKYKFINQGMLKIEGVNDSDKMKDTKKAFNTLGFTQVNKINFFSIDFY